MAWLTGYDGWSFYIYQAVGPAWRANRSGGAAAWTRRRAAHRLHGARTTSSATTTPTSRTRPKHPMEDLALLDPTRGWADGAHRGRTGQLLLFGAERIEYSAKALPEAPHHRCDGARELAARDRSREPRSSTCAAPPRIVEHDARAHPARRPSRACRSTSWSPRSITPAITGVGGHWGDYPAIVPMAPSGMDATAPHLTWDDTPLQTSETHVLRDRRRAQPLPLPAVAHAVLRQAAAALSSMPRRPCAEATEAGLEKAQPGNRCEDIAERLQRRAASPTASPRTTAAAIPSACLSAGLGRAHHVLPRAAT